VTSLNITSVASAQANLTASISCAQGSVMTSGGCDCKDSPNGIYAGRLQTSKPSGNGWSCACVNTSSGAEPHPVVAHAVCMLPGFSTTLAP
jgi:hypothetical protein